MGYNTEISWTQSTWNPVLGCSKVSEGCRNCYAIRSVHRMAGNPNAKIRAANAGLTVIQNGAPNWTGVVRLIEDRLEQPLHWRKPRRIFVNSLSDLFHDGLTDAEIDRVFAVMALCPQHTFQVLTKRAARMQKYFSAPMMYDRIAASWNYSSALRNVTKSRIQAREKAYPWGQWPLPNVWLGVSVEDQKSKSRIDSLRETPATVRFLSIEPLLEDIGTLDLSGISWVVVGGESGPGARPTNPAWVRSLRDQCQAAGVAYFWKQWGEYCDWDNLPESSRRELDAAGETQTDGMIRVGKKRAGATLDGRQWREFPR